MRAAAYTGACALLWWGCASIDGFSGPASLSSVSSQSPSAPLPMARIGELTASSAQALAGVIPFPDARPQSVSAEPPGMTPLEQRAFNCVRPAACETNWIQEGGSMSIVQDPYAPKSAPNVAQMTYVPSLPGGSGPANAEIGFNGNKQKSVLYISAWIKYSANFQSHPTSVNKEIHFFINGGNRVYSQAHGNGTPNGPLVPAFGLQGIAAPYNDGRSHAETSVDLLPNLPGKPIIRGQWQHHEILLTANTPGVADGSVEMWLGGTKVLSYKQIMIIAAGAPNKWEVLKWNPTWGGGGGTIVAPFYMQMDDIYISGK